MLFFSLFYVDDTAKALHNTHTHTHTVQELVEALVSGGGSPLLDEVHLCVLRTLAGNESPRDRKRRKLPLEMLDEVCVCVCVRDCECVCALWVLCP